MLIPVLLIVFIAIMTCALPACAKSSSLSTDSAPAASDSAPAVDASPSSAGAPEEDPAANPDPSVDPDPASESEVDPEPEHDPEISSGLKYVAHRGYSAYHLANTEEAFLAAAERNFYGIETDIRKTKDGYFVCNHDATVLYADGTEKSIFSSNLADLLVQPLKNDVTDRDNHLCTFETYLRACKSGNKVAVIELKDLFLKADILQILDIVDAEYDRDHVTFISFHYSSLLLIKNEDPMIELQYLSQTENDNRFASCLTEGLSIDVRYTILTEDLLKTFHDAGLAVNVWTVDDASVLESMRLLGVDYVTTDIFYEE